MNRESIKGDWKKPSRKIKLKWHEYMDGETHRSGRNHDHLLSRLHEKHALSRDNLEWPLKGAE